MKYQIIFNPMARNRKSKKFLDQVCGRLDKEGLEYVVHSTESRGHAEKMAGELSKEHKEIIVVGGDGTIHEVINGISNHSDVNLALIPAGTGNDFCGGFNGTVDSVMDAVIAGKTQPTDFMEFNDRICVNVGGTGLDVSVLEGVAKGKMKSSIKYTWCLIKCVFTYKAQKVRVVADGYEFDEKALIVAVCNGTRLGGGLPICPTASVDDKKIEVVIVKDMSTMKLLGAVSYLLRNRLLEVPLVEHITCNEVEFIPEKACTIQMDGELYHNVTSLKAKVRQALNLYR